MTDVELGLVQSQAEAIFYQACRDQLPDDVLVVYSSAWTYKRPDGSPSEGEADFVVFFPKYGLVVVEVKGGGVDYDPITGKWSSTDRNGKLHPIKDPFRQATKEKHAVLDQLKGHAEWARLRGRRIPAGNAVFFPDCDNLQKLVTGNSPKEIVGGRRDLQNVPTWFANVNRLWKDDRDEPLGDDGVLIAEKILCAAIHVRPLLAAELEREEDLRIKLTRQQAKILRTIGGRTRAIISGGAGTGKTLIAVEKARLLSQAGQTVLLLCYNRPLADHLRKVVGSFPGLQVMSFHQLCERRAAEAKRLTGRDLLQEAAVAYAGHDKYDVQMPFALAMSNEVVDEKYDAVIIDEAQDFSDEYWFAIDELLKDQVGGHFFVFMDPNQSLYRNHVNLPIKEEPFLLTVNCRNTSPIHSAAYHYYSGEIVEPPPISGAPIDFIHESSIDSQAAAIAKTIGQLIRIEHVKPADIAVLLARSSHSRQKNEDYHSALLRHVSSAGAEFQFGLPANKPNQIHVDTVSRFKGLESAVIILWLADPIDVNVDKETLYVGLTRAKSRVVVVGLAPPKGLLARVGSPAS